MRVSHAYKSSYVFFQGFSSVDEKPIPPLKIDILWGTIPDLIPTWFLPSSYPPWGFLSLAHWWAGTSNRVVVPARQAGIDSWAPKKSLQFRALYSAYSLCTLYNTHVHLQYTIHSIMLEKRKTEELWKLVA